MAESRPPWGRLAALAAAVLVLHAWLLSGPGLPVKASPAPPWLARTLAAAGAAEVQSAHLASPPAPTPAPTRPRTDLPQEAKRRATLPASGEKKPTAPSGGTSPGERATAMPRALPPPSGTFHYVATASARGMSLGGEATLRWEADASHYDAQLELRSPLTRPRIQHSSGTVGADGLSPSRFSDRRRTEEAAHFRADTGTISFSGNRPEVPLQPGAQDRLSVLLQLAAMVAGDPSRFSAGTEVHLQVASTQEAPTWIFVVEGTETLVLPGASLQALKLHRQPRQEYDQRVELWLAPGAAYAPVRVRLTQPNGDGMDLQWSSTDKG